MTAPSLVLEDGSTHAYLTAQELRRLLAPDGDEGVEICVLNCCWSLYVARELTSSGGAGVPVIVAHQYPLRDATAPLFAASLYSGVSCCWPVAEAVGRFRDQFVDAWCGGQPHVPDWGNPAVVLGVAIVHIVFASA